MIDIFERHDVVKVHIRPVIADDWYREDLFLIILNENGTYGWICYQKGSGDYPEVRPFYSWADMTSAEFDTIEDAIIDCTEY